MRLIFAGTPDVAVPSLRVLAASDHDIATVVTRPDAPIGRRRVLTPSPVAAAAEELGLPVLKTARLDEAATARLATTDAELGVIVAYGGLVREPLLSMPEHGWINLHFSLLPRWRGAAPVQHALIAGDEETGASVFRLVAELDAGDVFEERRYAVPARATAGVVLNDLAGLGAELLRDVVAAIEGGRAVAIPQAGAATFAPKLTEADGAVDWNEPADRVAGRIRGVTPEPGAHTTVAGIRIKLLDAEVPEGEVLLKPGEIAGHGRDILIGTATQSISVSKVQPAGRPVMSSGDWWRGVRSSQVRAGT
ncbi:methionyl-tRNA formyltransferase [Microbacterium sp. DT81.1]|uniref:methionyl-tRNA formyltransferase n=1 Tax=Microbacterium sp. DT81.1 TaxID=3393413 RepID=UPI003CFA4DDB